MNREESRSEQFVRCELIGLLPRLRRFARGLTGNAADADDILQSACEKALRHVDQWIEGSRLDSWLYRIIQTTWLDELRARQVRGQVQSAEDGLEMPNDGQARVEARLILEDVRRQIALLPVEQRSVLLLVCVEGLGYREAADVLRLPIGTVMSRLARARGSLLTRLGETRPRVMDGGRSG